MKTLVQIVEFGVGVSIVIGVGANIIKAFNDTPIFDYIENIFRQIGELIGLEATTLFYSLFLGVILIHVGRWALSWSSSNGGQTPNNRGN